MSALNIFVTSAEYDFTATNHHEYQHKFGADNLVILRIFEWAMPS